MNKKELRKHIISRRDEISVEDRKYKDKLIFNKTIELKEFINAKSIFIFVSFGSEVDTHEIIKHALTLGKKISIPLVNKESKTMEAREISSLEDMKEGYYGILEPSENALVMNPGEIDLIIMPGVAFDLKGGRIGYGAGFYDKFLVKVPSATPKIALAYDMQRVEEVPMDTYDVKIDGVITEDISKIFQDNSERLQDNREIEATMPIFFTGHGNPMNAIMNNAFTRDLESMGQFLQVKPKAILVISAHWLTRGSYTNTEENPKTIYDFVGFPQELFDVQYPAPGAPDFAHMVIDRIPEVSENNEWGIDHGTWSVLTHMFPKADIPVFQLSIDFYKPMEYHYELGKKLRFLREQGVLILGSGNVVHNIPMYFRKRDMEPYNWATDFNEWVKEKLKTKDFQSLINYESFGNNAKLAVPTTDHYIPMIYILGLLEQDEEFVITHDSVESSMSMLCFKSKSNKNKQ